MKGQVSIEFFAYFGITMVALAVMYTGVADRQVEALEYRESSMASNIASGVAYEIEQAKIAGDGYERELTVPEEIFGDEYTVEASSGFVEVEWGERSVLEESRFEEEFEVESGDQPFTISNEEGDIVVE